MAEKTIDKQYLEGITFTGATSKKAKDPESGRERLVFTPFSRPAGVDDVLAFSESAASIRIVMKDGRKYDVEKKASKKDK